MSITESRAFGNLNQVLEHKDDKFVKEKEQDKSPTPEWKVGYSTQRGKVKYRKLDDTPRLFDGGLTHSPRTDHNVDTIMKLSDVFSRAGVEQMKARVHDVYEQHRDSQEVEDGPLSDEAEYEVLRDLDQELMGQIRQHVQVALGYEEGQLSGVERVTVRQVKDRIPEVDKLVQSMVDDFVARFDPEQGLTEKTTETVTTMVSPTARQNMDNVIGELKGLSRSESESQN